MTKTTKMANFLSQPNHSPTIQRWNYGSGQTPKIFKVAFWNVNGIRSVLNKGCL